MKKKAPQAADIMNDGPVVLTRDSLVREAARAMWQDETPVGTVVDDDYHPIGVISQQGLLRALLDVVNHEMPAGAVMDYLDPDFPVIEETASLVGMAEIFARQGYTVRGLPVTRDGKLVGIVLRRDVVHAVMEYLKHVDDPAQAALYLSALKDADERPSFE